MRYSSQPIKQTSRNDGFTLIEVLIIAPIVLLVIGGFIALMVTMVGDVLATRDQNKLTYDTQNTLDRIEQDVRISVKLLGTTGALTAPQGSNSNFTGASAFTNTDNTLMLSSLATSLNPADDARQLIYYANQPNACGVNQTANIIYRYTVVYFVKSGSLWRRTIMPTFNTNAIVDANTVCSTPWQRNSCSPGYTTTPPCQSNDTEVMQNVTSLDVEYYAEAAETTEIDIADIGEATTVQVTINGAADRAGRSFTVSESVRATRINDYDA